MDQRPQTHDQRILRCRECQTDAVMVCVKPYRSFQMKPSGREFAFDEQDIAEGAVAFDPMFNETGPIGDGLAAAGGVLGDRQIAGHDGEVANAAQHREQRRHIAHCVADASRFRQHFGNVGIGVAARRRSADREADQQRQFGDQPHSVGRVAAHQIECGLKVPHRLHMRGAGRGMLPRFRPKRNCLRQCAAFSEMVGDQRRFGLPGFGEPVLQFGCDLPVQGFPLPLQKRIVGGIPDQRVLEQVGAGGRHAPPFDQAGPREFAEILTQGGFRNRGDRGEQVVAEPPADGRAQASDAARGPQPVEAGNERIPHRSRNCRHRCSAQRRCVGGCFQYRLGHFLNEQRNAVAAFDDLPYGIGRKQRVGTEVAANLFGIAAVEASELDRGHVVVREPGRFEFRAGGTKDHPRMVRRPRQSSVQQFERGRVAPLEVFQHKQRRPRAGCVCHHGQQGIERDRLAPIRCYRCGRCASLRCASLRRDAQQIGDRGLTDGVGHAEAGQQRRQLGAPRFRAVAAFEPGRAGNLFDNRVQRIVASIRAAIPGELDVRDVSDMAPQLFHQTGFADTGFAAQQYRLALSAANRRPHVAQHREFGAAAHHGDGIAPVAGQKAADGRRRLHRLEGRHRHGKPLERDRPKVAIDELPERDTPRGLRDQNRIGFGHRLQPSREIGGAADDAAAASLPAPDQFADDDQSRCDADAAVQGHAGWQVQPPDGIADLDGRVHRVRRIVLIRAGVTEIRHHAIAHILRDLTAVFGHDVVAGSQIGVDDLHEVFRRQAQRQGDKIHEGKG